MQDKTKYLLEKLRITLGKLPTEMVVFLLEKATVQAENMAQTTFCGNISSQDI